jgi:hypothetical protein
MLNASKIISSRDAKSDFRMLLVLVFCFVSMSFFAVGFIYAQALDTATLVTLMAITGVANVGMLYYLLRKLNSLSST